MIRSRLGVKALGLCALMLGLLAFASAAQAEVNSKWVLVNKSGVLTSVTDTLQPEVQIKEIEVFEGGVQEAILLTKVAGIETALLCTNANLLNAAGTGAPKMGLEGTLLGKVTFTGCITKLKGVTSPPCKPHAPALSPEGTITTELAKGLVSLHATAPEGAVFKIVPDSGETFVTVTLGTAGIGNECAIGEKLPVSGQLSLQSSNFKVEEVEHLIKEFAGLTDLWVLNKTAEHKATIDGSAWARLLNEHEGFKWAGIPG
jgi:hypothetical protein